MCAASLKVSSSASPTHNSKSVPTGEKTGYFCPRNYCVISQYSILLSSSFVISAGAPVAVLKIR
jgi:hypothetical protein